MKQLKAFLFILSIALIASCSPKEESPELVKNTGTTGGTGGGGGGTGGGGGGGTGGGTGSGPIANPFLNANYFDPSGVVTGGTHTSVSFSGKDTLGEFRLQGFSANKTIISLSFPRTNKTGTSQFTTSQTFFIPNTDSAFAVSPYDPRFVYFLMPMEQNSVNISKIDTIDHTIKGTFSFRGLNLKSDTFSIATGSFELNYTK